MKNSIKIFALFLGAALFLSSCGSTDVAEKTADSFFLLLIKGKPEKANKFVSTGFDAESQLAAVKTLASNERSGKLLKATKTAGFNTEINNGITTVKLPYELKYENETLNYEVVIVDRGEGFKIENVQ